MVIEVDKNYYAGKPLPVLIKKGATLVLGTAISLWPKKREKNNEDQEGCRFGQKLAPDESW